MSFGGGKESFAVKKFETQQEVEEKRRARQAHWETVRKADDPAECPEQETRSLFEQLEANKMAAETQYEEQNHMCRSTQGLVEEDTKFLNFVSNRKVQLERERREEESEVVEQMKEAALKHALDRTSLPSEASKSNLSSPSHNPSSSTLKKSQQTLLVGAIKRKSTGNTEDTCSKQLRTEATCPTPCCGDKLLSLVDTSSGVAQVAGVLPGIGFYRDDSSDSRSSSDDESDIEDFFVAKKVVKKVVRVAQQ